MYRQKKGGPIGLRASGSVAKVAMEDWLKKFEKRVKELGIEVFLLRKYLDDVILIVRNCKLGERYLDGRIQKTEMSEEEVKENGKNRSEITLDILL